jgi:hypothetical protein
MTTLQEAAQKALEALETLKSCKSITIWCGSADDAMEALKAALAQPVGWKLVPIAPTVDMLEAMKAQNECGGMDNFNAYQAAVFAAKATP